MTVFYLQTFVNEGRIPEQEYVTLGDLDTVRFGYDILLKSEISEKL